MNKQYPPEYIERTVDQFRKQSEPYYNLQSQLIARYTHPVIFLLKDGSELKQSFKWMNTLAKEQYDYCTEKIEELKNKCFGVMN